VKDIPRAIRRRLKPALAWTAEVKDGAATRARVVASAEPALLELWRAGVLAGRVRPEAYFIRCDATTTTPADTAAGRLILLVGYAPHLPAEFELLRFVLRVKPA
jgi:phage tail sheath protein FI